MVDYTKLIDPDFLEAVGTDASKWATAFIQCYLALPEDKGLDEGWMTSWFANAIETARSAGADAETERCAAIVQRARFGEIDGDFRSIRSRIESRTPADAD